jgi:hypothetical protein
MSPTTKKNQESLRRIAIGFKGGQVLSVRILDEKLTQLRQVVAKEKEDWLELEIADGATLIKLNDITYIRVESDESRVGF